MIQYNAQVHSFFNMGNIAAFPRLVFANRSGNCMDYVPVVLANFFSYAFVLMLHQADEAIERNFWRRRVIHLF